MQGRDWIYVIDFSTAIEKALEKGEVGQTYNVSTGNELTNKEVVQRILRQIGKPLSLIVSPEGRPGHDVRDSLSSERARAKLGWTPRHEFDHALGLTVKAYLKNEPWRSPIATKKIDCVR